MRKIYFFVITFFAFANISVGQSYTWNGQTSNNYQDATNWTPNRATPAPADLLIFNPLTSIVVINVPNDTIGGITINSGTSSVSFEAANNGNVLKLNGATPLIFTTPGSVLVSTYLTIQLNSVVTISSGTFGIAPGTGGKIIINNALNLAGGTLDFDQLPGGAAIKAAGSITYSSGSFSCIHPSAISWESGSTYNHALNGTIIPASTWQYGSTCNVTGVTTTAPIGIVASNIFFNFTWNCASQSASVDLLPAAGGVMYINGTLTITNTNNQELRIATTAAAVNSTVFTWAYVQSGGLVTLQGGAGTTTLSMSGDFNQSIGTLNGVGGSSAGVAILDLQKNVAFTASAIWQSTSTNNGSQFIFQFSGSSTQIVNIAGAWNAPIKGSCNIVDINTDINGINLTGILKVMNTNSAQPATCTMGGRIIGSGSVSYTGITTLIYSGNFFQTASAIEFPASGGPTNLTINNSLGVSFPASFDRTIIGTLFMLNGNLAIGAANTLSLTNDTLINQLNYTSGYITTGKLGRLFPIIGLPTAPGLNSLFPFGTGVNDRSLNVFFSASTLSGGTAGMIYVTHSPMPGVATISLPDNVITLDKRTNTNWTISTGAFNLGSGVTISLTAVGGNIGSVTNISNLRLTDASTAYGILINSTGTNDKPTVGKSGLIQSDINKTLYIGSDLSNALVIITFTWTGNTSSDWTNPSNWTGGAGYPSASTENAIINVASPSFQPTINSTDNISVNQLTVGSSNSLTMTANAVLTVYDTVFFTGSATFAPSSTFGYASSTNAQSIPDLPYGNLTFSGNGQKTLAPSITVKGEYKISGLPPVIGNGKFTYSGSGAQRITATNYYDLTITGDRSGNALSLGNTVFENTIDINNIFDVSGLSNYSIIKDFNIINFSSSASQPIPGFFYHLLKNSGNGARILDSLGSADINHVINSVDFSRGSGAYTVSGSKVKMNFLSTTDVTYVIGDNYYDLEFSGDLNNHAFDFFAGPIYIQGKYTVSITNYRQPNNNKTYLVFNGTGDQTITAFKPTLPNTPAFKYPNINIQGGNRNVTLEGGVNYTIGVTGNLNVPRATSYNASTYWATMPINPFAPGKGFIVTGSTVDFSIGSGSVPVLYPSVTGGGIYHYNNLSVTGGSRDLDSNITVGGNLSVNGNDYNAVTFASPATLRVGDAANSRILNVLGDVTVSGTGTGVTGKIDMNTGATGSTIMTVSKNLLIAGQGQITSTGASNGTIVFNGSIHQSYSNTSAYKNDFVNIKVGDGITPNTKLTLLSALDLVGSDSTPATMGTLTVMPNDSLDCGIYNIKGNGTTGYAKFDLQAGATLITANTGGIEGIATTLANGSIINDATMARTYSPTASYVFNASTVTPFPSAITPMSNLSIGDNAAVTLNKAVEVSNTLTFNNSINFNLSNFDLTLKSTASATARVAPVPATSSITYGSGRFIVERYYPMKRSWRLVTSPLSNTGSIFDSWQESAPGTYVPGKGMFVTGPNPTGSAGNGLDYSGLNNYSMKTYNSATSSYVNIGDTKLQNLSTNNSSAASIGYYTFVRGDRNRSPDNTVFGNTNNTTLRSRGFLQTGTQTFNVSSLPVTFPLVGNPYASSVDFNKITKVGINPKRFYVYDPSLGTLGMFVTMEENPINSGIYLPTTPNSSIQRNYIQSGQAFFVETDGTNNPATSVIFNENNKSTDYNPILFRPVTLSNQVSSIRTNLLQLNADNTTLLVDGNMTQFDLNFYNKVDLQDALKFGNITENLGILRNNKLLSVERRQPITSTDTLYFKLTKTTQRNYQFEFEPTNLDPLLSGFLEDSYTGIKTPVSLTSATTFNFTVNGDVKSAASDRFRIVFKASTSEPLPVTYRSIKAYQQGTNIAVAWTVENEINISKYEVEKSTDGVSFSKVNTTTATGANSSSTTYQFLDINAVQGNNFYRIRSFSQSGAFEYSRVVVVKIGRVGTGISIYPNPVKGDMIGVSFNNMAKGIYLVRLINTLGQTMMTKQLSHATGCSMETLTPDSKLSNGIYQLEVKAPDKSISTIKVIVQ